MDAENASNPIAESEPTPKLRERKTLSVASANIVPACSEIIAEYEKMYTKEELFREGYNSMLQSATDENNTVQRFIIRMLVSMYGEKSFEMNWHDLDVCMKGSLFMTWLWYLYDCHSKADIHSTHNLYGKKFSYEEQFQSTPYAVVVGFLKQMRPLDYEVIVDSYPALYYIVLKMHLLCE